MRVQNISQSRSANMRAVKSKNTGPEMIVRRLLFGMGYRYRLHCSKLPGAPDLVFSARMKVIFIHGCFWHQHGCKRSLAKPKANAEFWQNKLQKNKDRDIETAIALQVAGWQSLVVWECELKDRGNLAIVLKNFLDDA